MCKKFFKISGIIFLLFQFRLEAQYSITVIKPNDIALKSKDLWNCIVQNGSNQSTPVYLHGIISEMKKGRLLEIQSGNFDLKPGITQFNTSNYEALRNEKLIHSDKIFEDHIVRTNTIPNGNYKICISLFDQKTQVKLADQCLDFIIHRATAPSLISPSNNDSICDSNPFFIWSPVPEFTLGRNDISYSLEIFEILKNQSAVAAVKKNPAFFKETNITDPIYQYPLYAIPFTHQTQYAWHVVVSESGKTVVESDVRSFWWRKCNDDQVTDDEGNNKQEEVKRNHKKAGLRYTYPSKTEQDFPISTYRNKLNPILTTSKESDQFYYRIFDSNRKIIGKDKLDLLSGTNYFDFDVTQWNIIPGQIYTMCLTNVLGQNSYIKFKLPIISKK